MKDPLYKVPIAWKLVLTFLLIGVVSLAVGGWITYLSIREELQDRVHSELVLIGQAHAQAVSFRLKELTGRTEDFASDGFIRDMVSGMIFRNTPELKRQLELHLRNNKQPLVPEFEETYVLGLDGGLIASSSPARKESPVRADQLTFSQGPITLLPTLPSGTLSPPYPAHLIVPLFGRLNEQPLGYLGNRITLKGMENAITRVNEIPDGMAEKGTPFCKMIRTLLVPETGDMKALPGLGETISVSVPVGDIPFSIRTEVDQSRAYAYIADIRNRLLLLGTVLSCGILALLFFPLRFMVAPLRRLRRAVQEVEKGNYGIEVEVDSQDEIGELARSFNRMLEAIEARDGRLRQSSTDLEEKEQEIRREKELLHTVISGMKDAVVFRDPEGQPVFHNEAAAPLVRSCAECRSLGHNECTHSPGTPAWMNVHQRLHVGGQVYESCCTPLSNGEGGTLGLVQVARDITDRLKMEEDMVNRERLAVVGELSASLAHDLNNPMAAISSFAQLMQKESEGDTKEYAGIVYRNVEKCKAVVQRLLNYSSHAPCAIEPYDVTRGIRDVVELVLPLLEKQGIALDLVLNTENLRVRGKGDELEQVFMNLIMNAVQAMGDTGGRLGLVGYVEDGHIVIVIRDTGPGIDPEKIANIFDPFVSTKPKGQGTGLGLAISRRIVKNHGGTLSAANRPDGGAEFVVRIPIAGVTHAIH